MAEFLMFFARDMCGAVVDVTQVSNGAACEWTCLGCGAPLVAKQGKVNAWHFGHATGAPHRACAESALHLAGKELLREMSEILIPEVSDTVTGTDVLNREHSQPLLASASSFRFSSCSVEHTTGSRRLDALLVSQDGLRLGIEILVTHKVDAQKAEDLARLNAPVLELDLRGWVGKPLDRVVLKKVLGDIAPRKLVAGIQVLLAPQVLKAKETLASQLDDIARAVPRILALSSDFSAEAQEIAQRMDIAATPWPAWLDWTEWLQGQPQECSLRQLFSVHHRVWQAACAEFVSSLPTGKKFTVEDAVDAVHLALRAPQYVDVTPEHTGLSDFLGKHLQGQGRVRYCGNDDHGYGSDWYQVRKAPTKSQVKEPTVPKKRNRPDDSAQLALF